MPESLQLSAGSQTDLGLAAWTDYRQAISFEAFKSFNWFSEEYPGIETREQLKEYLKQNKPEIYELGKTAYENIEKYGCATWYEWRNANWDTKWNAYEVDYKGRHDEKDFSTVVVEFLTAWAPPSPIYENIAEERRLYVEGLADNEGSDNIEYISEGDEKDYWTDDIRITRSIEITGLEKLKQKEA